MKYSCDIIIDKPRQEVIEKFDSVDNLYKWMPGLLKFEAIEGIPGEVGCKSKLTFQAGKRKMEMIETIIEKSLPNRFCGTYEMKGVLNIVENVFEEQGDKTKYTTKQEFQLKGFLKIIGMLAPSMFKKQSQIHLIAFKKFVEST